ncbi:MAG: NAD(P)H-hydrate dehydratase [Acidimicrobiales bacterium]
MEPVLGVAEMREVDEIAKRSVPLSVLVDRAGTALAGEALEMLGSSGAYGRRVVVIAGPGNNGNDGRVAARHLARRGARVVVFDVADAPRRVTGADLVIDAAYGTGYRGTYEAPETDGAAVLAADVPTGLDATSGVACPRAVQARRTVTFGTLKPGMVLNDGPGHCGVVVTRRIGLPIDGVEATINLVCDHDVVALLPARARSDHKWSHGVVVVAGSPGMYGAATYVVAGAGRGGAGMVRLGVPGADPSDLPVGAAVGFALEQVDFDRRVMQEVGRCRAIVLGPGLGRSANTAESICALLAEVSVPAVVDADALSALGTVQHAAEVIGARSSRPVVLTPHDGEFARLTGARPGPDRIAEARALAARTGATVLLKGPTTVVAGPDGRVLLAAAGSARLATAGSGDVLSGMIGAFLARGVGALEAAALAAHVHGRAAGRGRAEGLLAGDLPDLVADVLSAAALDRDRDHFEQRS